MNQFTIYIHKNKVNGKVYIGQTSQNPIKRWDNGRGYITSPKFYNAIQKYGWNNFEHIILEDNLNYQQSKEKEKYYINLYRNNCYNKTNGGEQGKTIYLTQKEYEQKYIDKKNKIIEYCKNHHEEMAKKSREFYYKNEEYRKRKIEYQREYRKNHKK